MWSICDNQNERRINKLKKKKKKKKKKEKRRKEEGRLYEKNGKSRYIYNTVKPYSNWWYKFDKRDGLICRNNFVNPKISMYVIIQDFKTRFVKKEKKKKKKIDRIYIIKPCLSEFLLNIFLNNWERCVYFV